MASRRLKHLYHEGQYLERPFKQFETLDPRANEIVHSLSKNGEQVLKEAEMWHEHSPSHTGNFKHAVMTACITASFELGARERGFRYIHQHELLQRAQTRLEVDVDGILIPDGLFALEMNDRFMVFFLEVDRGTEPLETKRIRKSWKRNVQQYKKLLGSGLYKGVFKLKAQAVLLNVTISQARLARMIDVIQKEFVGGCPYILNHAILEFGAYFKPPSIMALMEIPWQRAGYPPYRISAAAD
jgi:hypothetical protein